ncbi:MAG: histidine--tRNA ligase [Spirochaetaceae bacterium]
MHIEPRILKGFRDFLPDQASGRLRIIETLTRTFEEFGFQPIDTPVLEYTEVLLGKGGGETDKQVYRFEDQGGRDVSMRFDLTVPLARFMAQHHTEIPIPFKRYHIDKVWRGENTQRGRYREFTQCDFDIVGTDSASADFEILLLMYRSFKAMGIADVTIKINHRGVFNRFLAHEGVEENSVEIMRLIDKLQKIGREKVLEELSIIVGKEVSEKILAYIDNTGDFRETLSRITELAGGEDEDTRRLSETGKTMEELDIGSRFVLDPSIMRGLDYYTGIVYETFFDKLPQIGSVCSGGRYNDLASLYTKTKLPGVGSSIGLDRLIAALEELEERNTPEAAADAAVFNLDEKLSGYYHGLAESLRAEGLRTDVFLEKKKLGQQFKLAEEKHIPAALICGDDERNTGTITVKNLLTRENSTHTSVSEAADTIKAIVKERQKG